MTRNLCFNLPRAGINFNDGAAGGDQVHANLIFNSVRETNDQYVLLWFSAFAHVSLVLSIFQRPNQLLGQVRSRLICIGLTMISQSQTLARSQAAVRHHLWH